jgi:hypothetical protein
MSNDTDVFVTLYSESLLDINAALAYLANKDRTWRFDIDQVKKESLGGYSARISGWANENSFNYSITGEDGELGDLECKFPNIEIHGWYRDEYSHGSFQIEKSYENDNSESESEDSYYVAIETGSLRDVKSDLGDALWLFATGLARRCKILELGSTSIPDEKSSSPECSFSLAEKTNLSPNEILEQVLESMRWLKVPADFVIKIQDNYENDILIEKVFLKEATSVTNQPIEDFLVKIENFLSITPKVLAEAPADLEEFCLNNIDEDGNSALHFTAANGTMDQVPTHLLTIENLTRENHAGETPLSVAHQHNYAHQLPAQFKDRDLSKNYKRKLYIEKLLSEERDDLADYLIKNFPNPLLEND